MVLVPQEDVTSFVDLVLHLCSVSDRLMVALEWLVMNFVHI